VPAAIDNAGPLGFGQLIERRQQQDAQRRVRMHEQMRFDQTSGGQFPGPKRFDAVVPDQLKQLESVVETHAPIIMAGNGQLRHKGLIGRKPVFG
jgi:hypothetical protein